MDSVISRSRWILVILIGAMCLCGVRLVQLQIIEGPVLAAQGQRVRTSSTAVAAARGSITAMGQPTRRARSTDHPEKVIAGWRAMGIAPERRAGSRIPVP